MISWHSEFKLHTGSNAMYTVMFLVFLNFQGSLKCLFLPKRKHPGRNVLSSFKIQHSQDQNIVGTPMFDECIKLIHTQKCPHLGQANPTLSL